MKRLKIQKKLKNLEAKRIITQRSKDLIAIENN